MPWKPGESGNPKGRNPHLPEIQTFARVSPGMVKAVFSKYLGVTIEELRELSLDTKLPAFDAAVVSILVKIITQGDMQKLNYVLDRLIGKVKEVDPESEEGEQVASTILIPREELIRQLRQKQMSLTEPLTSSEKSSPK